MAAPQLHVQIEVEGLKELQSQVRKAKNKELDKAMRGANKQAADVVVADAVPHAPVKTGALQRSIKSKNDRLNAVVQAGGARAPYVGPIMWGWPKRNIKPRRFLPVAISKKREQIREAYADALRALEDLF